MKVAFESFFRQQAELDDKSSNSISDTSAESSGCYKELPVNAGNEVGGHLSLPVSV